MSVVYDVIVAGLGAMGSLTAYHLARRGHRVLGLDQFTPPHTMGSSHGQSRIIREAYFEDPRYVPLVQSAYRHWAELEAASGATIFRKTGGLMLGPADGDLVRGARRSAELHGLPHEILGADEVRRRFPVFRPSPGMLGVWEPRAGILSPEAAIAAALQVARARGAEVRTGETLLGWNAGDGGVEVVTSAGRHRAVSLVITVGAWTRDVFRELQLPLRVQRNVQFWFSPRCAAELVAPGALPVFIGESSADAPAWYGFPDLGDGLKIGLHKHGPWVDPGDVDRNVSAGEAEDLRRVLERYMPDVNGELIRGEACLYTMTPDEHFVLGRHPSNEAVIFASPCSGHGFKFSSVIGEMLAELATGRTPAFDVGWWSPERFRK